MPKPPAIKRLWVVANRCTGCRLCEAVCAVAHFGVTNPEKARLSVVAIEERDIFKPMVCRQCNRPLCIQACPAVAISRDDATRIIKLDNDLCDGCGKCVEACSFQVLRKDPCSGLPLVCDLCQGRPRCVEFCDADAIVFSDIKPGSC